MAPISLKSANVAQCRSKSAGRPRSRYLSTRWFGLLVMVLTATGLFAGAAPEANLRRQFPVLPTAHAIHALAMKEAKSGYRVRLRGVITFHNEQHLFIQDSSGGIWIHQRGQNPALKPGDEIEVRGIIEDPSFAPQIAKPEFEVLGTAPFPKPRGASFQQMVSTEDDCLWVEVVGTVRSV
ncbi:MAG: hypothetical protein ACRD2O_18650, partial [Terriglobia bacterium]